MLNSEKLTKDLEKEFSQKLLISRSRAYQKEGNLKEAMADAKRALTMGNSPEVIGLIQGIMEQSSYKLGLSPVDNVICEISNSDMPKNHRMLNANNLLAMSRESACHRDILGKWDVLFELIENDQELREILLSVFHNLSMIPNLAVFMIVPLARNLDLLLNFESKTLRKQAMGIIGNIVSHYSGLPSFELTIAEPVIMKLYEVCLECTDIEPELYACIVKILSNISIVLDFLSKEKLIVKLVLSGKENNGLMTVGLFSRIFEQLSKQGQLNDVMDLFVKFLLHLLEEDNQLAGILSLSAVIQTNHDIGALILEKEGILHGILDTVEFEREDIQLAVVELLSHAASNSRGRKAIGSLAKSYLLKCSQQSTKIPLRIFAYTALSKLMIDDTKIQKELLANSSIVVFFSQILNDLESSQLMKSLVLEALSFMSIHLKIKEAIVVNISLLNSLKNSISVKQDPASQYALAVIFTNLVAFPKQLSAEELQLKKLHKMASATTESELEDTAKIVEKRTEKLVELGFIPVLKCLSEGSENTKLAFAKISLAVATNQKHRGAMIQSSYCRKLLSITNSQNEELVLTAGQTLAKIAITSDPNLAFKGELAVEVLRPLVFLLAKGSQLAQFESLMGLTNLAGVDDRIREHIIRLDGFAAIQELQFCTNIMIRRAATEAISNLLYHPVVFSTFLAPNSQILKVTVALCDDDDFKTKRAASGAVAILSSEPDSIPLLFTLPRFEQILLSLLSGDNPEILHRGAEIVKNVAKCRKLSLSLANSARQLKNCSIPVVLQILAQISTETA